MQGKQVSPAVAAVIVIVVVVVAGLLIWHQTGGRGRTGMTPEVRQKMQALLGRSAPGNPGMGGGPAPVGPSNR